MKLFLRHADLLATYAWMFILVWFCWEAPWWIWPAVVVYAVSMTAKDVVPYFQTKPTPHLCCSYSYTQILEVVKRVGQGNVINIEYAPDYGMFTLWYWEVWE